MWVCTHMQISTDLYTECVQAKWRAHIHVTRLNSYSSRVQTHLIHYLTNIMDIIHLIHTNKPHSMFNVQSTSTLEPLRDWLISLLWFFIKEHWSNRLFSFIEGVASNFAVVKFQWQILTFKFTKLNKAFWQYVARRCSSLQLVHCVHHILHIEVRPKPSMLRMIYWAVYYVNQSRETWTLTVYGNNLESWLILSRTQRYSIY